MRLLSLIALLSFSTTVFAAEKLGPVFPTVYNYGTSLLVQVHNNTDKTVSCSGSITAYLNNRSIQHFYYSDIIHKGSFGTRSFYVNLPNVRIINQTNFINCY